MIPSLVLHRSTTTSDERIARVAASRGYDVVRLTDQDTPPSSPILHYGNTPWRSFKRSRLPITFHETDWSLLAAIPWVTRREITLMRLGDLEQPLKECLFVKPAYGKGFRSQVRQIGEAIRSYPDYLDDDHLIYVSRPVHFTSEIRCWCLDGEVLTSSFYRSNVMCTPMGGLIPLVQSIYERCPTLPRAVVMDFGLGPDSEWSLIEFNKPWASGLYESDPERCFDCVVASQSPLL